MDLAIPVLKSGHTPDPGGGTRKPGAPDIVHKDTFLKLLVAQIRHQNPLHPADGVEFLAQLTQFTQLEQLMDMRQTLEAIRQQLEPAGAPAGRPPEAPTRR